MGYPVKFSPQAIDDLATVVSYIAKDNPRRAESFGNELIDQTDILENFAKTGRIVPELGEKNLRELVYKPYRIIYRINEAKEEIEVLRYWHAGQGKPEL